MVTLFFIAWAVGGIGLFAYTLAHPIMANRIGNAAAAVLAAALFGWLAFFLTIVVLAMGVFSPRAIERRPLE